VKNFINWCTTAYKGKVRSDLYEKAYDYWFELKGKHGKVDFSNGVSISFRLAMDAAVGGPKIFPSSG
jgi:hypothetical protein